jgi:putative hemolysin
MIREEPHLSVRLATDAADLEAAHRLRYEVFVEEMGADGPLVDHERGLERDAFDAGCEHLVLVDGRRDPARRRHVVGVYRLGRGAGGRYCTEGEFDLGPLRRSGRRLLELGRSCVHRDYRGGTAMVHLWGGLADYVRRHGVDVLFGTASFHGTDPRPLAQPLSLLHHGHLAPPALRPRALREGRVAMDRLPPERIDRPAATRALPALIKGYLRLGGFVGEGAFVDRAFNTIDVCLVMDTALVAGRTRALYAGEPAT